MINKCDFLSNNGLMGVNSYMKHLNDPNINRKYNYLYKITNIINNKIYIGVHRTDNLNDGYMGSGKVLKRSILKYGKENFKQEILEFYSTYKEALNAERKIVTIDFINEDTNYNLKEGGYGNCGWCDSHLEMLSNKAKQRYEDPDFKEKMKTQCWENKDRNKKLGKSRKAWIKNNEIIHKQNMDKINKNPEKIKKTAETHTGMTRTEEAKKNISKGISDYYKNDSDGGVSRSGKGKRYIYNPTTNISKRVGVDEVIPKGWVLGSKPKDKKSYEGMNVGSYFAHNSETLQIKRFQKGEALPEGWIKGRPKK